MTLSCVKLVINASMLGNHEMTKITDNTNIIYLKLDKTQELPEYLCVRVCVCVHARACVVMVVDEMTMFAELVFISACYMLSPLLGCWTLWLLLLLRSSPDLCHAPSPLVHYVTASQPVAP